jgi:hypothetical protein
MKKFFVLSPFVVAFHPRSGPPNSPWFAVGIPKQD